MATHPPADHDRWVTLGGIVLLHLETCLDTASGFTIQVWPLAHWGFNLCNLGINFSLPNLGPVLGSLALRACKALHLDPLRHRSFNSLSKVANNTTQQIQTTQA